MVTIIIIIDVHYSRDVRPSTIRTNLSIFNNFTPQTHEKKTSSTTRVRVLKYFRGAFDSAALQLSELHFLFVSIFGFFFLVYIILYIFFFISYFRNLMATFVSRQSDAYIETITVHSSTGIITTLVTR